MILFVKVQGQEEPLEIEIEEDATISLLIAMVSSVTNHPPEKITITVDDKIIPPETQISSLNLGKILYFTATLENPDSSDQFLESMFNADEQRRIMQQIQQQRIHDNYEYAIQNNPEHFVSYSLLFISCKINNEPVRALIDTGAQVSILPLTIAQQCHVDYLIDRRFQSVCIGVGAQTTIGRIHSLQVQVDDWVWTNPFTVMEGPLDHCILGVDWMTKNQAVIDLKNHCLVMGEKRIPFLNHG
ncbi:aspartic peptidase [Histomonas meleagridis]|uniref:aspartic peptidase n=1 Tax=Histomonas meleagridis TaxID=135588 RepID=UPI0035597438|nr:aspartic peptidase [Histomonas meleagridis]KAH0797400.1 aspartic peptidase [Histomonas meleagridis]